MINLMFTLLDAAASQAPAATGQAQVDGQPSMMSTILLMVVLFAIIYFFMIRPQNKKRKEMQKFRDSLKVGQDVCTYGGMHGTVKSIDKDGKTVVLEIDTGTKVTFEKWGLMPAGTVPEQR